MTVSAQIPSIPYVGDGLNNTFSFAFTIIKNSDLSVFIDNVEQAEGIDYTIQNLTPAGGDVVFVVIPADLTDILLERETDITQQVDYMPFTEFPADTHEGALDKITLILQELAQAMGGIGQTVLSVFGRVGDVVATANDYIASLIGFTPVGDITATDVQAAIAQLEASLDSFLGEAFATSLHDGGELNIVGGTDIEIIAGDGLIIDSYTNPLQPATRIHLSWNTNQFTIVAPAVAGTKVFFTVADGNVAGPQAGTNLGVLTEYASEPSPDTIRDEILIGFAIHNGTAWQEVTAPNTNNSVAHTLFEYIRSLSGPFIESDGEVTQAASFQLDQAAGVTWELSRNYINNVKDPNREAFAARTPMQWRYTNRDFSTVSALTSTIDPSQYDNGGVVGPIGGASQNTTIQRLYLDQADNLWVLWGQNLHDNYAEAIGAIGADTTATDVPDTLDNSILLGYIIAERNSSDWTDEKAAFFSVQEAGGGGGGGAASFVSLTDTPADYIGQASKILTVSSLEDGVEFSTPVLSLMDDYQEGNHVATVVGVTSGSYVLDSGGETLAYTKIGRVVHVQGRLTITSANSPVGRLRVSLPFVVTDLQDTAERAFTTIRMRGHGGTIANPTANFIVNQAYCELWDFPDDGIITSITDTVVNSAFEININFSYVGT